MDDAFLALQPAAAIEQGGAERGAAEAFEDRRPDDQVGDAGLVLDGDKDDAIGAARALTDQDETGDRESAPDRQDGEVAGTGEAFLRQLGTQKGERVTLYRQPQGRVILDDMLAQRHFGKERSSEGLAFFAAGRPLTLSLSPQAGRGTPRRSLCKSPAPPRLFRGKSDSRGAEAALPLPACGERAGVRGI